MNDAKHPSQPPRLPPNRRPTIPANGAISPSPVPDTLKYDRAAKRLHVGAGFVDNVEPTVWDYEIDGRQVITQWFSYRRANRDRPLIGERRRPSALGDIQPSHWLAEYTTELINVLNVLGLLVDLEPSQAETLERICSGSLLSATDLENAGALDVIGPSTRGKRSKDASLF